MKRSVILEGIIILLIAGCQSNPGTGPFSTLTIAPPLNPYQSTTQTPAPPTQTVSIATIEPLIPTATPFKHAIQPGETLYGIAIHYNISLDRLVSANPGIASSLLSIGTELVIPLSEEDELAPPTPTPYPLPQDEPACYPSTAGGLWCYVLVENDQDFTIENISLAVNYFDENQNLIKSQIAIPPLNFLFPGQSIPVGSYIDDPEIDQNLVTATLLTAFPSAQAGPRILITEFSLEYSMENTIARVRGSFEIQEDNPGGNQIWIAATGFNNGVPVGVRKWIGPEGLIKGTSHPFDFQLYSLGPGIDQVQLLIELH